MKTASLVAAILACAALSAGPAAAQLGGGAQPVRSDARGLGVGVQVNRTGLAEGGGRTVLGAGAGLTVSYGTTDAVSLFARAGTGYRSSQLDLGVRYRFGSAAGALRPYLEGAVTTIAASRPVPNPADGEDSVRLWGVGGTVGAGVEYFVSPRLALDLGVTATAGRFQQNPATNLRDGFISKRVQVGIHFRP